MKIDRILAQQRAFVRARDWEQFHTPKNLAAALSVEASELLEIFQWMTVAEEARCLTDRELRKKIGKEMADVFFYLMRLSDVLGVDVEKEFKSKMRENARKYPVRASKGRATKYTELKARARAR